MTRRLHRTAWLALAVVATLDVPAVAQQTDPSAPPTDAPMGMTPFTIQGFGDINYASRGTDDDAPHSGFEAGALDLFVTSQLSDSWSAIVELVFEKEGNRLFTDLERFRFTYEQSDAFRVSVGRMKNPFVHWPIMGHHALFNQIPLDLPSVARPEDESGLWPMHFVGLIAQGRSIGRAGLSYSLGIGNGRGRTLEEIQVATDANPHRALLASIGVSPGRVPGFEISTSTYVDRIPAPSGALKERDAAVAVSYVHSGLELRAEVSVMRHQDEASDVAHVTRGWYVLAARRLSGRLRKLTPFALLERLDAAETEIFLEGTPDERSWTIGARWDASRWIALKSDFHARRTGSAPWFHVFRGQLAVNF
jgi:hypothetical protein